VPAAPALGVGNMAAAFGCAGGYWRSCKPRSHWLRDRTVALSPTAS